MKLVRLLLLALAGMTAAACGKSSTAAPTPPPVIPDAGGTVYLWESAGPDGGGIFYEMDALFPDPFWTTDTCAQSSQKVGSCCYFPPADGGTPLPAQLSSGDLTVSDVTAGVAIGKLAFVPGGGYPVADWTTPAWSRGDVMEVKSVGEQVPAFNVQVHAPAQISGLQPAWTSPISIPRSTDFVVGWTPDASAQSFRLILGAASPTDGSSHGTIWCEVPDSAGTLTVASSLLANFVSGDQCSLCEVTRGSDSTPVSRVNVRIQTRVAGGATFKASFP